MAMINKIFGNVTYYWDEREDAVAGKLKKLHDWCNVSIGGISGWMPRPQRFVDECDNTKTDGINADKMVDLSFDNFEKFDISMCQCSKSGILLHGLSEMPMGYNRTEVGP